MCDVIFMVVAIVSYVVVLALYNGYQVQEDQLWNDDSAEPEVSVHSIIFIRNLTTITASKVSLILPIFGPKSFLAVSYLL